MNPTDTQRLVKADDELAGILRAYPQGARESLIPILQDIQQKFEYLSESHMQEVADYLSVSVAQVYGVATFYNQFRLNKPGKFRVVVCRGTACHVIGSKTVLDTLETELGLKAGQTSRDGLFSLEIAACLGACSMAPVIMINDEFHGRLDAQSTKKLLKQLKARAKEQSHE